jgi:hypothetical protein
MSENNPLMAALKLPGRIFQLPSKGIFYKNGELDESVKNGEIHVHAMSALDEITMKNPDQLFSGAAIDSVLKNCVKDVKKPTELLAKDVDAITLFLRTVTYGPSYEFIARHTCQGAKEHSYYADVDTIISRMKMLDETLTDEMYTVKLGNGQTVKLRPNKYQQVIDLIKNNQNKQELTAEDQRRNLMAMLIGVIESVDNISNPALIEEWITALPAVMANRIGDKVESLNSWGSDLKWECKCLDCGEMFEVEIPINAVAFFTE